MTVKERIPLAEASMLAHQVVKLLEPYANRIEVLGSIRRGRPDVGDIEIGLMPKIEKRDDPADLFGDTKINVNTQLEAVERLIVEGVFEHRPDKNGHNCCGEGVQRLRYRGFALDIFGCLDPDAWGVTKLIRTGSGDFNKRIVTQKTEGGKILPLGMRFQGGRLWDCKRPVRTPEEIDVFNAIGLPYVEPHRRDR